MQQLITEKGATKYEMLENYRSKTHIVELANAFVKTLNNRMKVNPIVPAAGGEYANSTAAVSSLAAPGNADGDNINSAITVRSLGTSAQTQANGIVTLFKHAGKNLEIPVVNNLKETYTGKERACVLTCTNEEALKVTGLLIKEGYNARLIQENSGFNLYDLAEFRYLFKVINKETQSPVISDEIWEAAKTKLRAVYAQSSCLDNCLNLLEEFERGTKYKADLEILIRESKFEDFYKFNDGEIVVSTIHKAKGREFDSVYLLISNGGYYSQETRRQIYVGLTRAKSKLFVHYNNGIFDSVKFEGAVRVTDNNIYPEPEEITAQLTHRDIYLNFFKSKREIIRRLISGQEVKIEGNTLYTETPEGPRGILVFSKKYREDLTALAGKGYNPYKAKVRFVTAWKGRDDEGESVIFLPDIYYKKNL
jgi:ATP-dependent DNA helicase RecQ